MLTHCRNTMILHLAAIVWILTALNVASLTVQASAASSSSSSSSSSSRKQPASRFYFSDLEKYIETKTKPKVVESSKLTRLSSSSSKSGANSNPSRDSKLKSVYYLNESITAWLEQKNSASNGGGGEYDESNSRGVLARPTTSRPSNKYASFKTTIGRGRPSCRSRVRVFKLNISSSCEPLDYRTVECAGFCSSRTMLWKNAYETSNVACCSLVKMYQEPTRLYCLGPLEFDMLVAQVYESWSTSTAAATQLPLTHAYMYDQFRENFVSPNWTDSFMLMGDRLYSGYYSIPMVRNATCRCLTLD